MTEARAAFGMTAEEFQSLPDDGRNHELVFGSVVSEPPPGREHGRVTARIVMRLGAHVERHGLGVVCCNDSGYVLARRPDTVRGPDISFVRATRVEAAGGTTGYMEGAPDLAVEVLSPGDRPNDVEAKVADYLAAGARLVWIVDPERRTVRVHRKLLEVTILTEADLLDGEEIVPGFSARVGELFE